MIDFDPDAGGPYDDAAGIAVFPDAKQLIAASTRSQGREADEYRIARVPETDVYVLYGVYEDTQKVLVMCIRTHQAASN